MPSSGPNTPSHSRPRTPYPAADSGTMAGVGAHGRKSHDSSSRHSHERATNDTDALSSATSASTSSSVNTSANASTGSSPSRGHQPFYYIGALANGNILPTPVPALPHPNAHPNLLRKPNPMGRRNSYTLSPLDTTGAGPSTEIGRRPNTANVTAERGRSFDRPGPPERPARSLDRKRSASLGRHESRSRGLVDLQSSAPPPPLPSLPDGLATASPNSAAAANANATSNSVALRGRSAAPAPPSNLERARSVATQSGSSPRGVSRSKRAPSQPRVGDKNQTEEISVHIMDGRGRRAYYPWAMDVLRDLKSPQRD